MRLARVFLDSDLRCSHIGLRLQAKKANTDLTKTTVMFMNRKWTAFKLLTNDQYVVHYNAGRRIPYDAIRYLPQDFGGTEMEMTAAIKKSLSEKINIPD